MLIQSEQEAAVAILFSAVLQGKENITEQQIELLSKALVLCSKFKGIDLNESSIWAMKLQAQNDTKLIFENCAPLIAEDFRETLFAMVSEIVLIDGKIDDERTKVFAMLALYLQINMERMKMILATYLIRNKWNVEVVEQAQ